MCGRSSWKRVTMGRGASSMEIIGPDRESRMAVCELRGRDGTVDVECWMLDDECWMMRVACGMWT